MKKIIISCLALLSIFCVVAHGQLEMNSSGEVGIGATPTTGIDLFTPEAKITHLGVNASPVSGIDFYTPEAKISTLGINVTPTGAHQLWVQGIARFGYSATMSCFEFKYLDMYDMQLLPTMNNSCVIGSSSYGIRKVTAYNFTTLSDKRQKENIQTLSGSLDQIIRLQGVKYDLKKEFAYDEAKISDESLKTKLDLERKGFIGFLAQDVYEVLPEVVSYDEDADIYTMNYLRIIPVLVEAIKEQQTQIDDLKQLVASSSGSLKGAAVSGTSLDEVGENMELTSLFQNHPNPFSVETTIGYYLTENITSASLFVYDMTGKQLKNFNIYEKGSGEVIISSGELDAGLYMYSLVADGKLVGTKQMILTKN